MHSLCMKKMVLVFELFIITDKTRSPKEHHGSPCDGSVKSAGPLCCHTQMGNNQAHRTKCLWQDVGTISTGMLVIKSL